MIDFIDNQTMSIEHNQNKITIEPIERNRIIAIWLSNAIESQSNGRFLDNIQLRSIGILRSIDCLHSIGFIDCLRLIDSTVYNRIKFCKVKNRAISSRVSLYLPSTGVYILKKTCRVSVCFG